MENKYNLKVGDVIIAKDNIIIREQILIKNKKYEILEVDNNWISTTCELGKYFACDISHFDIYFELTLGNNLSTNEFIKSLDSDIMQNNKLEENKAYKEKEGKLFYELDWDFITQMAERMASNKGKYEPYNWKKLDNVEDLKQALFRHVIDIMKGNYEDDGREFGHLEAAADDLMMINYQLRNNYNKSVIENKTKANEEDKVILDDLDLQNTNKSFLPEHNPFEEKLDFDKLTGFILDDIIYKILKVDKDIILKKSVLSDYIYEYSKKRFMEKYNLGRIKLLYGEF